MGGLACSLLTGQLHFHIVGILTCAMLVATTISAIPALNKMEPGKAVTSSLFLGWLTGSFVDVVVLVFTPDGSLSAVSVAVLFTAGLFLVVIYDVGNLLANGNPDDFMRVIISMDSALLVVISIPIFALIFGCHHMRNIENAETRAGAISEAQRRAARAADGMTEQPVVLGPPRPLDP